MRMIKLAFATALSFSATLAFAQDGGGTINFADGGDEGVSTLAGGLTGGAPLEVPGGMTGGDKIFASRKRGGTGVGHSGQGLPHTSQDSDRIPGNSGLASLQRGGTIGAPKGVEHDKVIMLAGDHGTSGIGSGGFTADDADRSGSGVLKDGLVKDGGRKLAGNSGAIVKSYRICIVRV